MTIHQKLNLNSYINNQLVILEKQHKTDNLLTMDIGTMEQAVDVGMYLAFKRISERI